MKKLMLLLCLAQAAFAAITLTVTAGNGQLVPANFGMNSKPIVINVQNAGTPVAGATVTIACTIGGSSTPAPLNTTTPVTDASGNATVLFLPGLQTSGQYVMQYTCTGTYSAVTASFISTGYYTSPTLVPGVYFYRLAPSAAAMNPYTAAAGSAGTPIKIEVVRSDTIQPVANIAVRLLPQPDGTAGTQQVITVAEGTGAENSVLTDANGYATLTPTFTYPQSAQSSSYETFKIDMGSFNAYGPFQTNILAANSSVLPSSPPSTAPNPGVGAHAWWRLYVTASEGSNPTGVNELSFYDSTGTVIPTTGGTPFASPMAFGVDPTSNAAKAFDSDVTTHWDPDGPPYVTLYPQWVGYKFSSAVNVANFYVVKRADIDNAPTGFKLQYSDNGTSFSDATAAEVVAWSLHAVSSYRGWGLAVASPPAGSYLSYRINVSANSGGTLLEVAELAMSTAIGGSNVTITDGLQAQASQEANYTSGARLAFDGNTSTFWGTGSSITTGWLAITFRSPKAIAQITVTPSATLGNAPHTFTVEGSNDAGQTWTVITTCSMTWGSATPQTCNIAPVASAPPTATINGNTNTVAQRGNIDYDQIAVDARHGDGTKLQTSDNTGVYGNCAMFGAKGAVTDSGAVCSSSASAVTGVGLAVPAAEFAVSGSPVSGGNGTITVTKQTQAANTVWRGPASGGAAVPVFGPLVTADMPAGTGTVTSVAATVPGWLSIAGSPVATSGTLAITAATGQTSHQVVGTCGTATSFTPCALVAGDLSGAVFFASGASHAAGAVPDPGSTAGTARFLREDATFATPAGTSLLTTKGDLFTYGTANQRLPVGANGQVLTADSTQAAGIKWAAASGGSSYYSPFNGLAVSLPPAVSTLTWVNQGTATATDLSNRGIYMTAPSTAGDSFRCLVKTAPATPYTFTTSLIVSVGAAANYANAGIVMRDSTTGKLVQLGFGYSGAWKFLVNYFSSPTAFSSQPFAASIFGAGTPFVPIFYRVTDNGTNFIFSVSFDGYDFSQVQATLGRTAFLANPDQVGICLDSNGTGFNMNAIFTYWNGI